MLVSLLFWWPLAILNYHSICHCNTSTRSTLILTSLHFCIFSIPLQAHHQEPERKAASLNCGRVTRTAQGWTIVDVLLTSQVLSAQDRLSIPQETELKAAYISLAPNDEGLTLTMAANSWHCPALRAPCALPCVILVRNWWLSCCVRGRVNSSNT